MLLISSASQLPAFQQRLPDEQVIVTANPYPVPYDNLSRSVTVLLKEDIAKLPAHSIADVLLLATPVDVRARAPFGLQADFSLRGTAYSQVLVLVDGIRINDSQTGHHNNDIPIQMQDIERIEVLMGPGSSIYGTDAFGGIINIITARHAKPVRSSVSVGEHGLVEGSFGVSFQKGKFEQSLSASGNRSSGFRYDRDFNNVSMSSRINVGEKLRISVSHMNKEFGAYGFYGPSPSREWTDQTLVSFDHQGDKAGFQGYYRTHGDRFIYDIRSPGLFKSDHRTQAAGVSAKARHSLPHSGWITLGGEAGGDWIASQNLGDHAFARTSLFSELQWSFGKSAALYSGLRLDNYSNFGSALNPSLSGSWWVLPRARLRTALGRAFRIPTFTELYYRDPNNEANSDLKPESSWSAEVGADIIPAKDWLGSVTLFSRRERNVIDWIRGSTREKWRTANIGKLSTAGIELSLERAIGSQVRLAARYSIISSDVGKVDYISKYVLDYAHDSLSGVLTFRMPLAMELLQTINYKKHADGRDYWLLGGRLERSFYKFSAALEYTNLLDRQYQQISGVDMPGRWFIASLRTR
jgi:outer membrane receptor for ferrienterochelin and colicin